MLRKGDSRSNQSRILKPGMIVVAQRLVVGVEGFRVQEPSVFYNRYGQTLHEAPVQFQFDALGPHDDQGQQTFGYTVIVPSKLKVLIWRIKALLQPVIYKGFSCNHRSDFARFPSMQ